MRNHEKWSQKLKKFYKMSILHLFKIRMQYVYVEHIEFVYTTSFSNFHQLQPRRVIHRCAVLPE